MDQYIEIAKLFAGNFAPHRWQSCQEQIVSISSNFTLLSILGKTYSENGQTIFGLSDLRSTVPLVP